MRFSLAVPVMVVGLSLSGLAQQTNFKVKSTHEKPAKSSVPLPTGKTASTSTPSSSNARSLQSIERESAKTPAHTTGTKKSAAIKPVKDKPQPPINFTGNGGGKNAGMATQSSNPYKGRLKKKAH